MAGEPTLDQVSKKLLELLPPDGSPVLNRVMRTMLQRKLEKAVTPELYSNTLDALEKTGQIGRLRGQGGQIFFVGQDQKPRQSVKKGLETLKEAELMDPLCSYLSGPFSEALDLPADSICIVQDTSALGPRSGRWARPDYILITAMRFNLLPGVQVDVHSFELKTESGATDLAVYEALAQTRFTHFGHLVWHLPDGSPYEGRLSDIQKQCEQHGIGLILMRDPTRLESYDIILDPSRKHTLPRDVDGFLESRLNREQSDRLGTFMNGDDT